MITKSKKRKLKGGRDLQKIPEFITYQGNLDTWDYISVLIKLA